MGKVTYYGQEKARIYYHIASYKRIVERVEWLDDKKSSCDDRGAMINTVARLLLRLVMVKDNP